MIPIDLLKKDYGTEIALVVLACRVYCKTVSDVELQNYIIENKPDWKLVGTICRNHSIRPVVYKTLLTIELPGEIETLFKEEYLGCTVKNWKQALETERIISLLAENGIQAWPYKGTAFSSQFYGDIISRESSDIDLVIHPKDLCFIIPIMENDGYKSEDSVSLKYLGEKYFLTIKEYNFNKIKEKERVFHIEFHWSITEKYLGVLKNADELLFKKGEEVLLAKSKVKGLNAPEHGLSILIHHSIKDGFTSLKNIVDIAKFNLLIEKRENSNYINKFITDLHLKKIWAISHLLCFALLGIRLAENEYNIPSKVKARFLYQLLSVNIINPHFFLTPYMIKTRFLLCETIPDQLKFLIALLKARFTPTVADFMIIKLPHSLFFIYYICKPFRSLIKPYDATKEKRKIFENNSLCTNTGDLD